MTKRRRKATESATTTTVLAIDPARQRGLRRNLLRWYAHHQRDLPWRRTCDPYAIWLSEIMLQQTRVEAGIGYYERFLAVLPSVEALAAANVDTVLKLWEGLGYYSRARNLHRAARQIVRGCGGAFPQSAQSWQALPGVGRYTAGAIASIAFGESAPVVDGNVKRVLARWFAISDPVDSTATTEKLWQLASTLVHPKRPGDWNQALMELGALVCIPRAPRCDSCPVRAHCSAFAENRQAELPLRGKTARVPHKSVAVAWLERRGRVLLGKRPDGGMLAGLWELPGGTITGEATPSAIEAQLSAILARETGVHASDFSLLSSINHTYSHFSMTLYLCRAGAATGRTRRGHYPELRWVAPKSLGDFAMPQADRKAMAAANLLSH